ncbi:MAG: hypothetical protein K5945_02800 [Bacteroidaceae bacterium]|nr:hypothetical protein [Bacteroidaceae bacterium]
MKKRNLIVVLCALLALPSLAQLKKVNVYRQGEVVYSAHVSEVDSIAFEDVELPVADLLDVQFKADGSAVDVSPMKNTVTTPAKNGLATIWSDTYQRYIASFSNSWGSTVSGYYKIDYTSNSKMQKALSDGHSLEVLVKANYTGTIADTEAKPFSSMQGGGTGFLICKTNASGSGGKNVYTFLPHVNGGWKWTTSGVTPKARKFYHLVGVWNQEEGKAYIYVNGELRNTVDAAGSFKFPGSGATWFCIGGDPNSNGAAEAGWCGEVAVARAYDKPLVAEEVSALWAAVADLQGDDIEMVTDVDYLSGMPVKAGSKFLIQGKGFAEGDKVKFVPSGGGTGEFVVDTELTDGGVRIQLPNNLTTTTYSMTLMRGNKTQDLGMVKFTVVETMPPGCKVIAHRGHWNVAGSAQNSRTSLQKALDLKIYGSETDIWITTDGVMMVNHDASFGGVRLETSTSEQVKALTLSNGEKMPSLEDLLNMVKADDGPTKLIIEIKTHSDPARGQAAADSTVNMVHRMGLRDRVEYIAFSLDICKRIVQDDPEAHVAYLNGDRSPAQLYEFGIMGLDYTAAKFRSNPTWVTSARELGMTTNVWTIDGESEIIEMNNMGIDYITTNNPEAAARILQYYEGAANE